MKQIFYWLPLIIISLFTQCIPPSDEILTDINLDFKDKTLQKIYDFQDTQNLDSLYHYFQHKDPSYRYAATMAFASIKKEEALDSLYEMLNDPVEEVKVAAAYAIGQVGEAADENRLIAAFNSYDTLAQSHANAAILEAIGKCGDEEMLNNLSTISTYKYTDTVLLEGQAWGIYRFALRELINRKGTEKMVELATDLNYPQSVRLIAANYLNRAQKIRLPEGADKSIADAIQKEEDPRIRMALVIGLGKTKTEAALNALIYQLNIEQDYRVRCNIVRSFANFEYEKVQATVFVALKDKSLPVGLTAANFFLNSGTAREASNYWRTAKDSAHWQIQLVLYSAAHRHLPSYFTTSKKSINWELKQRYLNSTNNYEKVAVIKALAEYGWNYRYIKQVAFPSDVPVIRTASIEAIDQICNKKAEDFRKFFGAGYRTVRREMAGYLVEAIQSGDAGMMYAAASTLRKPGYFFKGTIDSLSFLQNALGKLSLPQEIETYNEVKKALDYFVGDDESPPMTPEYNHEIEWRYLSDLSDETRVAIQTSKGEIKLELLPDIAPGTVSNFVQLIKTDFYLNKNFHRVVPNFVIQAGCPRGDGFGSLDYSIRSELPYLHYDAEGYVGMASAGNHTECTQFFITHSPTPHLDGNYTIFAKVAEGMDVVHEIEVGDLIEGVEIQ